MSDIVHIRLHIYIHQNMLYNGTVDNNGQSTAPEEKEIIMALTRKFLSALGIESDVVDEIIEAHSATVDALKEERDKANENAKDYESIKKQLDEVSKENESLKLQAGGENPYKKQYDELKAEYDQYKSDQEAKETKSKKTDAFTSLLKELGISEKRLSSVIKVSADSIDKLDLDKDGKIKDVDTLKNSLKEEWSDFIVKNGQQGANTQTPPGSRGGEPHRQSRAAQLASQYQQNLYGTVQKGGTGNVIQ